jgi:hypothetical protein
VGEGSAWDTEKLLYEMDFDTVDFTKLGFLDFEIENIKNGLEHLDYQPNLTPQFSGNEITDEQIEKRAHELAQQMIKEQHLLKIQCPFCDEEFEIDSK